jgi:3-methyladenine DNA glycosylase/8-oxoguanine DNA glycosylase
MNAARSARARTIAHRSEVRAHDTVAPSQVLGVRRADKNPRQIYYRRCEPPRTQLCHVRRAWHPYQRRLCQHVLRIAGRAMQKQVRRGSRLLSGTEWH